MIVCVCNNVNAAKINELKKSHSVADILQLKQLIAVCDECQTCKDTLEEILLENVQE